MTESRRGQRERRARRRTRRHPGGGSADRELAQMMDGLVPSTLRGVGQLADALDAECWASELTSMWRRLWLFGGDVEESFAPAFVRALARRGTRNALAALRALSMVGPDADRRLAERAADELAARRVPEPKWSRQRGQLRPLSAVLMCEETFDDGAGVLIEFSSPTRRHTLGIYVDYNLGGLVKDAFLAGPLSDIREEVRRNAPPEVGLTLRDLELSEARARVERALDILDHTLEPPISDDVRSLRALIDARLSLLPSGWALAEEKEMPIEERERLLEKFLASPEGVRWRGNQHACAAIARAIDFGADFNHGGPLRWSPVVVEIFMTSWLARKVVGDDALFASVAEVLPDWVRYAGRIRGLPAAALAQTAAAVQEFREEMLSAVADPRQWGPAKLLAMAAEQEGVDLHDPAALRALVERVNARLAA